MADFKIKKGYEIPISGDAPETLTTAKHPAFVGVCPIEFPGLKPRLDVTVDDEVEIGSPLFHDKRNERVRFLSPAAGRVSAINYGPRRVIEEIIITTAENEQAVAFDKLGPTEIAATARETLIEHLQKGGVWPYLRRRPYVKIAHQDEEPKAIFVNCMDTAPLANNPDFSLRGQGEAFRAGIEALKVLSEKVYVATSMSPADTFQGLEGVDVHRFSGTHPAGLVGTHITKLNPINKGEVVWFVNARDLVMIGRFLLDGRYPTKRVVAIAGPAAGARGYHETRTGVRIGDLAGKPGTEGEARHLSGNVLSGTKKAPESFLGFYDDLITVLPEGGHQEFIGWMSPGLNKPSFSRTYLTGLLGMKKKLPLDTSVRGGRRAIIMSGFWERVTALDVYPEQLAKACVAQDIDQMEQLGILECDPEDFALCTYVDPSKTEVSKIIAEGLELMEKEG